MFFSISSSMFSMGSAYEAPRSATPISSPVHLLSATTLSFDPMEIDTLVVPQSMKRKLDSLYESINHKQRKRARAASKAIPTAEAVAIERQERKVMRDCRVIMESTTERNEMAATLLKESAIKAIFFRMANNSGSFDFEAMSHKVNLFSPRPTTMHLFEGGEPQSFPGSLIQMRADRRAKIISAMQQATLDATTEAMLDAPEIHIPIDQDKLMPAYPMSTASESEDDPWASPDTLPDFEDDDETFGDSTPCNFFPPPTSIFPESSSLSTLNPSSKPSTLSSIGSFKDLIVISGKGSHDFIDGDLRDTMRKWNKARTAAKKTEKRKVGCKKGRKSYAAGACVTRSTIPEYTIREVNDFYDDAISIIRFAKSQIKDDGLTKSFQKVVVHDPLVEGAAFIGFENEDNEDNGGTRSYQDEDVVLEDAEDDGAVSSASMATTFASEQSVESLHNISNDSLFAADEVPTSSIAQRMELFKQFPPAQNGSAATPAVSRTTDPSAITNEASLPATQSVLEPKKPDIQWASKYEDDGESLFIPESRPIIVRTKRHKAAFVDCNLKEVTEAIRLAQPSFKKDRADRAQRQQGVSKRQHKTKSAPRPPPPPPPPRRCPFDEEDYSDDENRGTPSTSTLMAAQNTSSKVTRSASAASSRSQSDGAATSSTPRTTAPQLHMCLAHRPASRAKKTASSTQRKTQRR